MHLFLVVGGCSDYFHGVLLKDFPPHRVGEPLALSVLCCDIY